MTDYLLFIDTEASGLPKKWHLPYASPGNWPDAVQVSWLIFKKDGEKIKEENLYISNDDFDISASALRIHGLTKAFLQEKGMLRKQVLSMLSSDLKKYHPMVVGHFIELDYHILSAGYSKEGMGNPMENLPVFCIMKASKHLQQNPHSKYLRLGDLYELLFKKPLLHQHNALVDAAATADCFFELVKRNEIKSYSQPAIVFPQAEKISHRFAWVIAILIILLSVLLIAFYYG